MNKNFINPPKPTDLVAYSRAYEELKEHFASMRDVVAVYEYGTVTRPGVSDLDIFVVTRDKLESSSGPDYEITSDKFPAVCEIPRGTLMIVAKSNFEKIRWLDDNIHLRKVFGEDLDVPDPDEEILRYRRRASIIDWLPERMGNLAKVMVKPEIDITFSLRALKSIGYDFRKIQKISPDPRYEEFLNKVTFLRDNWSEEKKGELLSLLESGIDTGFKALEEFSNASLVGEEGAEGCLYLFKDLRFEFTGAEEKFAVSSLLYDSRPGRIVVSVPKIFAPHFSFYSQQPGFLAEQMRKQLSLPNLRPRDGGYCKYLENKMALATAMALFLLNNKFKTGLFRFGFYYHHHLEGFVPKF